MKIVGTILFLCLSMIAHAQRVDFNGGWSHVSGNGGLDGFNVGGSFYVAPKVSLGFNYDGVYDTSSLGAFSITNVGEIISKSHLQDFLTGPRIYLPGLFKGKGAIKGHVLVPFAEVQFGESNLYSKLISQQFGTTKTSDTEFTWVLGGGADFNFSSHWAGRINGDLVRTHFADAGQSRFRLIIGPVFKF
jgi:opacity protein-like surface antigen